MNNILTLLRLEFKSRYGNVSPSSGKSWMKGIISLVFYAALVYLVFTGATVIFRMFDKAGMAFEALVILFTAIFIFLLTTGVSSTIKVLYFKGDNVILMRFPVTGSQVFISKTLFLFISQMILAATIVIPFTLAYGSVVQVDPFFYYMVPVAVIFLVLIPFFLSNIFAIPIMQLTNKIRNKFALIIVLLSLMMALMFTVYMMLFERIVEFMNDSYFSVFSAEVVVIIKKITAYFIPTKYFADILYHKNLYAALPILIMLTGVSLAGMVWVIAKLYQTTLIKNVEIESSAFLHKTTNKKKSIFRTLLNKEFIQVFRSVNYSFQYFVLACSMPVMVYYCNSIAQKIGKNSIGEQINVGMTILVMLIFAAVVTSFSATSVTREGNNFYQTKTMPVPIRIQLAAKFVMYLIVSFASNFICMAILVFTKMMDLRTAAWVFGIVQLLSIGLTLRSMRFDIRKPSFNLSGEGEVVNNNSNTTSSILMGFMVAVIEGILAMAIAYISGEFMMIIICSAAALLFFMYALTAYLFRLKKTYDRISR